MAKPKQAPKSSSSAAPAATSAGGTASWFWTAALLGNLLSLACHFWLVHFGSSFSSDYSSSVGPSSSGESTSIAAKSNYASRDPATSSEYFTKASTFMASKGEGYKGWLHLLASYDMDPENEEVLSNLVHNYRGSRLTYLALDELENVLKRNPQCQSAKELAAEIEAEEPEEWEKYQARKAKSQSPPKSLKLVDPQFTIPFATAFAKFDLTAKFPDYLELNKQFYDSTVVAYDIVKKEWRKKQPGITDTELNHKFFQWQMGILRETGDYWEGYTKLKLFRDLMDTMTHSAALVLEAFGFDRETARRKANHEVIFWASVHTENSIHEPHQTEDSLIGGVYYVTIPPNSGVLDLFDPRGKMRGGLTLPDPPFHRVYTVQPKEGTLVLFPGWLVHTVRASKGLNVAKHGYRISISVNLKGEWQDTTKLTLENVNLIRT